MIRTISYFVKPPCTPSIWRIQILAKNFIRSPLKIYCLPSRNNSTMEPLLKGKTQYWWPPCTNYLDQLLLVLQTLFTFFKKQATLIRRSAVLSLPFQLVFPDWTIKVVKLYLDFENSSKSESVRFQRRCLHRHFLTIFFTSEVISNVQTSLHCVEKLSEFATNETFANRKRLAFNEESVAHAKLQVTFD
jgi:hypothetical protein